MSLDLLFPHFETLIRTPEDVARLNEAILGLAMQGKLVPQDPADEPASELLKRIRAEKRRLEQEEGGESNRLLPVSDDEIPYDLPSGWRWVRLPEIYHAWGQKKPDERFTYIDVSSIDNAQGAIQDDLAIIDPQDAPSRARKIVRQGTVIYSTVRPYLLNIAIVDQDFEFPPIASTAFAVMHPFEGVLAKYLFYYLRSRPFIDFVESQMTGMAYPAINDSKLNLGLFPLPPLAEQRRIVAKVESLFAQTRALEAKLRQAQADIVTVNRAALHRLSVATDDTAFAAAWATVRDAFDLLYDDPRNVAELRQAILQLAVQGKLVPQDPADEPASDLLKRIRAEKRRLVKEGKIREEKPLPLAAAGQIPYQLPEGWSWGHFIDVANIATESTDPDEFPDLPHIAPDNIEKSTGRLLEYRTVSEDEVRSVNHHFYPGQILYSKIRPNLSKAVLVEFEGLCSADMYPIEAFVDGRYLLRYILSGTFLEMVTKADTRVAMPKVNQDQLSKVLVAVPPLAEQRRIVAKVDQLMRQCDALAAGLARAEGQRRALTAAVLGGASGSG